MTILAPGARLGRFEISGVLGEGAMGIVYLAHDPQIDRPVALKTLKSDAIGGEHGREIESRFLKEARLAGRLSHPQIVTIYEAGEDRGVAYIAMERVDGEPLSRWLQSGSDVSLTKRIGVVRQVALALEHAHERGVLHRDIKPGNILVTRDGRVKVADFGIGRLLDAPTGDLTRSGQMIGSPAYMSPEQIRGEKLDGRSDLFSLGVVLYELLTGVRPFPGDSITTLVYQILHTEPRDPLLVRSDLPPATSAVLWRLLAKAPGKRPASAREFSNEMTKIEEGLSQAEATAVTSPAPSQAPPTVRAQAPIRVSSAGSRASGPAYLFGAAAVILATAALVWIWKSGRRAEEKAAGAPPPLPAIVTSSIPGGLAATPTQVSTPAFLPTAGPSEAADAIVGAPRILGADSTPVPGTRQIRRTLTALARTPFSTAVESSAIASGPADSTASRERASAPDNVYRTRRYARFGVSPDQARIYLDGRYVGIADDWDNHGGGKTLEIGHDGSHHVRLELPGYRTLRLEVLVSPSAGDEMVDIGDELKQESKVAYPKIPKLDKRTLGPVEFDRVEPLDAVVSEGGRTLGLASSFGPDSPLKLSGPAVHDLVISAPGHRSKTVRILVASNADSDIARVKVSLKKE